MSDKESEREEIIDETHELEDSKQDEVDEEEQDE
jgi:hypothetical protein